MTTALVYGLAIAGESAARALRSRGVDVIVADDTATPERAAAAEALGAEFIGAPNRDRIDGVVRAVDLVCPSPGVPETHPVVEAARTAGVDLVSEIELAYRWEQERDRPRPMLAVTGTDGKTTTTLLSVAMLAAAGLRAVDAGNTSTPLVDAIDDPALDAFVVECTSFRLAWTPSFRAEAAAWLNLAPDHLDWHRSMESYESAKGRIFLHQRPDDASIGFVDDPVVMAHLQRSSARRRSFGISTADYCVCDRDLVGPDGTIAPLAAMRRRLPHDVTNTLAASALVLESGLADPAAIRAAVADFVGPAHRLESLGTWNGVEWFNDSKATTPHAARAAIAGFEQVVLIAGGYDKGVDLGPMAAERGRVAAVLAIGATTDAIVEAFTGVPVIERAEQLDRAVQRAATLARPGDVVLLSPGCASFDHYGGFEERGEHFRRLVRDLHREGTT